MKFKIEHLGGSKKEVEFIDLDAPRPWIRVRYPNGGGIFSFALAHGGIEHKRGEFPEWFIPEAKLEELRELARDAKIKFSPSPRPKFQQLKPSKPRKKTEQKQLGLFGEKL